MRARASGFDMPCHLSGSDDIDRLSSVRSSTETVCSPLSVVHILPVTPTKSPTRRPLVHSANRSFGTTARWTAICTRPDRSCRVPKAMPPKRRHSMSRPASCTGVPSGDCLAFSARVSTG